MENKEKPTINQIFDLYQDDKDLCRDALLQIEKDPRKVQQLLDGFERIVKTSKNQNKIPDWWK